MSQTLIAVHGAGTAAHVLAAKLPAPHASVTVPLIVVFAVLAAIALLRKLIAIALIAIVLVATFAAYQSGAFGHWVDKGKQVVQQHQ